MTLRSDGHLGLAFLLEWSGMAVAMFPALMLTAVPTAVARMLGMPRLVEYILGGLAAGLIFGGLQALVFRTYFHQAARWVTASCLGFTIGGVLAYGLRLATSLEYSTAPSLAWIVGTVWLAALPPSLAQAMVLNRSLKWAGLWMPVLLLALAGWVMAFVLLTGRHPPFVGASEPADVRYALGLAAASLIFGLTTGGALWLLWWRPQSSELSVTPAAQTPGAA